MMTAVVTTGWMEWLATVVSERMASATVTGAEERTAWTEN